jgi:predicted P-loop ATPase/GTPase
MAKKFYRVSSYNEIYFFPQNVLVILSEVSKKKKMNVIKDKLKF